MQRMSPILVVLVVGCGPAGPMAATTSGEGTTAEAPTSTTVAETAGASSGGTTQVGTSSTGTTEGGTFIVMGDMPKDTECDVFAQDCSVGEKCAPYANDGVSWNDLKCVPVMADPAEVGEECFVVGNGVSGIDNCEGGSYCWGPDEDDQGGTCLAFCTGSPETPMCESGFFCAGPDNGVVFLCFPMCNPLEQDCPGNDLCIHQVDTFMCVLDASGEEGQFHDPCNFANACDPGLFCADTSAAEECDTEAPGCCEPFCDLTLANTCPGVGQVCSPLFEPGGAPEGYEDVGLCAVPE